MSAAHAIDARARERARTLRALIRLDDGWQRRVRVLLDLIARQERAIEAAESRAKRAEAQLRARR